MIWTSSPAPTSPSSAIIAAVPRGRRTERTVSPCPGVRGFRGTVSSAFWVCSTRRPRLVSPSLLPSPSSARSAPSSASVALDVRRDPAVGVQVGPRYCSMIRSWTCQSASSGILRMVFSVGERGCGVQKLIVARLDQLLSRELRQLVVDPHSLMIPPEDEARPDRLRPAAASENEHHVHRPIRSAARLRRTDRWCRGASGPSTGCAGLDGAL